MFTHSSTAVQGGSCDTSRVHQTYYRNNDFVKKVKPAPVHGIQVFPKICHHVSGTNMPPRASQLTESKTSCWKVSLAANDNQLASAFSRNTAILIAGREQPNWSDCHVFYLTNTMQIKYNNSTGKLNPQISLLYNTVASYNN